MAFALTRYDNNPPYTMTRAEEDLVEQVMREFAQFAQYRNAAFASHWEEVASLIMTSYRNTFYFGSGNTPGEKNAQLQVDATGMIANHRFGAICDSLLTPRNLPWHGLEANNDYVMKDRASRLWFEEVTKILFRYRYAPHANFASQNQNNYQSLGAFGTGSMFTDAFDGAGGGIRYRANPLGETFFGENHQGIIDRCIRWFKLTAYQAEQKWPGQLPPKLQQALKSGSLNLWNFLHYVVPRENDYDAKAFNYRRLKWRSIYLCMDGPCIMKQNEELESGYTSFPYSPCRYDMAPNETYGRGPAMLVLPSLKTLNSQKRTFLKQGHRAADPVLLTADDGATSFNLRPGSLNKGAMSADGKALVGILPTGDIATNEKMMEMEKSIINSAFLVELFQILTDTSQMTATQVIERVNEKGILLAPTVGRQSSEYLGPLIDRELDILAEQRLLPPMPPRLREAKGSYKVEYTNPMAKAQKAQSAAGFMRTIENVRELSAVTQDPSLLDPFNFDTAIPEIAKIQSVPESWMAAPDEITQKRKNRAQAQQQQQDVNSLPARAAMIKAQAAVIKGNGGVQPQQGQPQ